MQLALINDSTSLYQLQEIFYPTREVSPDTVEFIFVVTINTILLPNNNSCYSYNNPWAFKNSSNHYVRYSPWSDHFSVSIDASSNAETKLTAYIDSIKEVLEGLEYTSYNLIMTITNMQLSSSSNRD